MTPLEFGLVKVSKNPPKGQQLFLIIHFTLSLSLSQSSSHLVALLEGSFTMWSSNQSPYESSTLTKRFFLCVLFAFICLLLLFACLLSS